MRKMGFPTSQLYLVLALLFRDDKVTATASSTTSPAIAPRAGIFPAEHQRDEHSDGSLKNFVSRHPRRRFYQQLQKSQRCSSSSAGGRPRTNGGTRFSLRFPTPERVERWYTGRRHAALPNDDNTGIPPNLLYDRHRSCAFNHGLVGMTNPTLSVSAERDVVPIVFSLSMNDENSATTSGNRDQGLRRWSQQLTGMVRKRRLKDGNSHDVAAVQEASTTSQIIEQGGDPWWPGMTHSPKDWRVLRFRRRVGKGKDCYERCRDAALAWEFQAVGQGMIRVEGRTSLIRNKQPSRNQLSPSTSTPSSRRKPMNADQSHEDTTTCSSTTIPNNQHTQQESSIQQICSNPGRQLVTYTSIPKRGGWMIPHLYTINPVTVVYDLVDQRAPGTTYTATAYATRAGHLLCGEERVTVCHRDRDDGVDVEILSVSRASNSLQGRLVWPFIGRMQRTFFQQQLAALQHVADKAEK